LNKINCFEAHLQGLNFDFKKGIPFDEISEGQMFINGIGSILYREPMPIDANTNIEDVFCQEKDVWVGEKNGHVFLFQAGIDEENIFISPVSIDPKYQLTKYVKLHCQKEDLVIVLGDGRILSRIYIENEQISFLALQKEAVVNVTSPRGATAMFECTESTFKIV